MVDFGRIRRFFALVLVSGLLALCLSLSATPGVAADTFYYRATVQSSINPVTASYLERAIRRAETDNAQALIVALDTPGGLMTSMNKITQDFLNAEVPVVVWVGPSGARAASAGVFITYAAHYAAMAEGTRIGAAHPVGGQGQKMSKTMEEKVTNDAVAQLESIAKKRGRNADLADSFVRHSTSLTATEALEKNVVEAIVSSPRELVETIAGDTATVAGDRTVTFREGPVRDLPMSAKEDFLNTLVNPNLVYILLMIGIYGLIYEFAEPGIGFGAAIGGICLLLALYGMSVLPVNYAGLALLGLGVALMFLDIFVPSFGVLTLGGVGAFALGSVFLFETEAFSVSLGLIVGFTAATVTAVLVAGYLILGALRLPSRMGGDALVGKRGSTKSRLDPEGMVYVNGEYWNAATEGSTSLEPGTDVEVVEKRDRSLLVRPLEQREGERDE